MRLHFELYTAKDPIWLLTYGGVDETKRWEFDTEMTNPATHAVICYEGLRIVGILKITRPKNSKHIASEGTWVAKSHRRQGIALEMWRMLLGALKPLRVEGTVVTDRGHTLISLLQEQYEYITFDFDDYGERKLRKLK